MTIGTQVHVDLPYMVDLMREQEFSAEMIKDCFLDMDIETAEALVEGDVTISEDGIILARE